MQAILDAIAKVDWAGVVKSLTELAAVVTTIVAALKSRSSEKAAAVHATNAGIAAKAARESIAPPPLKPS